MSNNKPEALRLACMIEHYNAGVASQRIVEDYQQAADELRRLYFENEKFRASLAEQPAQRKLLTDEFLRKLHHIDEFGLFCDYDDFEQIARAIEAAHGINVPQARGGQE